MSAPTLHNNGTSAESLCMALELASKALREALAAFTASAPNARDYYPQGDGAYIGALKEWTQHAANLNEARAYIEGQREAVENQLEELERRKR